MGQKGLFTKSSKKMCPYFPLFFNDDGQKCGEGFLPPSKQHSLTYHFDLLGGTRNYLGELSGASALNGHGTRRSCGMVAMFTVLLAGNPASSTIFLFCLQLLNIILLVY